MYPNPAPDVVERSRRPALQNAYVNSLWHIVAFALVLRVLVAVQVVDVRNIWQSGFEVVKIAQSLVLGYGFSSPFGGMTGASAWVPPAYPLFLAGIFNLFGIKTGAAAFVVILSQIVFSALTCVPIFWIADSTLGRAAAIVAAWGWACFPYELLVPGISIWDSSISALLLSLSIWLTLKLEGASTAKPWIIFGLLWGAIALTNTTLAAVLPFQLAWLQVRQRRNGLNATRVMIVAVAMMAITVAPWLLRNMTAFGRLVAFRDNFGVELWIGNHEGGTGQWNGVWHPSQSENELSMFKKEGELAYTQRKWREATKFIRENPGTFARLSVKRVKYFWLGEPEFLREGFVRFLYSSLSVLAFVGLLFAFVTRKTFLPLAFAIFAVPVAYYITHVNPRYRHPIEPELMILSAYAVVVAAQWSRQRLIKSERSEMC